MDEKLFMKPIRGSINMNMWSAVFTRPINDMHNSKKLNVRNIDRINYFKSYVISLLV